MSDFDEIYRLYFDDVYKYVLTLSRNHSIAEEITQETFFKALKNIGSFKGDCKIYVWLCQIAKNTYFTHNKREKKSTGVESGKALDQTAIVETKNKKSIELKLVDEEKAFAVHKVLHSLDEPYKEVFTLRTFGELSFRKIGDLFDKTEVWARVTYYRAKNKIQEGL